MNNLWYHMLNKPPVTPPPAYFPAAWTILYILMVFAFLIILLKPEKKIKLIAINLFFAQLFFNLIWTYLFFEIKSIEFALIDAGILLLFVILTTVYFFKISRLAGLLMIPYILQVIFALYLNLGIKILN